jgi:hypothetical protein
VGSTTTAISPSSDLIILRTHQTMVYAVLTDNNPLSLALIFPILNPFLLPKTMKNYSIKIPVNGTKCCPRFSGINIFSS